MRSRTAILTTIAALALPVALAASDPPALELDLAAGGWELQGDDTVVTEMDGRPVLRLGSGGATYRGVELRDGTIELEMRVSDHRSFVFLQFRIEEEGEFEEVYFRPHKSGLPDAVQYTPVYKGSSQWQLYHDERATAAASLPAGEWIPVRLVVEGSRAAVFVGAVDEPQLVVPRLARDPRGGYLGLRAFRPRGVPEDVVVAELAGVVVHPGVVGYEFPEARPRAAAPGTISSWRISPPFVPPDGPVVDPPPRLLGGEGWQTVAANEDGLVELERHVTRPAGARRVAVLARLELVAERPMTRRLDLGFSDEVSVFLDGRLLVADDESYSFNLPRRQGLLTADQLSVFLPLRQGPNELVLAISDRFGGWGLAGRLEAGEGLAVEAAGRPVEVAAEPARGLDRLAWLAGCWRGEPGEECWLPPRGGLMVGVNRGPDRPGRRPGFELLRVVAEGEALTLLAQPGGRSPATPFEAVEVGPRRVVFANPEHDFPQRITYWLEGESTLRARVEALEEGEWKGFELRWTR